MISELRLAQIIATITELSEQKKQDLYKFLIDLRNKSDGIITDDKLQELINAISELRRSLGNKVDKVTGKSLSSNDFTNELRNKLVTIIGNVQANWNTIDENDPSYIANKPDLSQITLSSEDRTKLNNAVQKETGKGLSTNDFTNELKQKLQNLSEQVQSDWGESDNTKKSFIRNKPTIYTKSEIDTLLANIGGGGGTVTIQVQADWNETNPDANGYIKNKPTIPTFPSQSDLDNRYELKTNKVTSISSQSTDLEYPSAKCVYDIVGNIESALQAILN